MLNPTYFEKKKNITLVFRTISRGQVPPVGEIKTGFQSYLTKEVHKKMHSPAGLTVSEAKVRIFALNMENTYLLIKSQHARVHFDLIFATYF